MPPSQLPYFIQEHLVHSTDLHLSRKHRSTLALLQNLHLYEVNNKQILNFIDLQSTCLKKVQSQLAPLQTQPQVNGVSSQSSDILGSYTACPNFTLGAIVFGKYIYQIGNDKTVYILLKCWDSMVILKKDSDGFTLQAQYVGVGSFKICKYSDCQVKLAISFLHGEEDVLTNFQENQHPEPALSNADEYQRILNKIKMKQSELLVHKAITKKEFGKLKSTNVFGSNFLRTPRLEEMQILSKCSDAWIKLTADDDIVIGVPLVNNCSSRRTILRNIRGVLQSTGEDINYQYALYQLDKRLDSVDNIQSFFHSQDEDKCSWSQCADLFLLPDAFCVLVLKLKINQLFDFDAVQFPLFIFYDITESGRTFTQKCFLTKLSFRDIFTSDICRLNFQERHLHRDLLTVIATSYETEALLEHQTTSTAVDNYLCSKMDFLRITKNQNSAETMNVDGQVENTAPERVFFYNKNSDSVWHGTLLSLTYSSDSSSEIKLYTKTQEKSKVFLKLLYKELMIKCGIKKLRIDARNLSTKLIGFEAALRDECRSYIEICSNRAIDKCKKENLQNALYLNTLKTDMIFRDLNL